MYTSVAFLHECNSVFTSVVIRIIIAVEENPQPAADL
jgi:hypothetical protein